MLYKANGIVQSLTACSKTCPGLCQELNWTLQTHINNQQQSVQVQSIIETVMAGQSQYPKCRSANINTVLS